MWQTVAPKMKTKTEPNRNCTKYHQFRHDTVGCTVDSSRVLEGQLQLVSHQQSILSSFLIWLSAELVVVQKDREISEANRIVLRADIENIREVWNDGSGKSCRRFGFYRIALNLSDDKMPPVEFSPSNCIDFHLLW
jgi:hypothetical protein